MLNIKATNNFTEAYNNKMVILVFRKQFIS